MPPKSRIGRGVVIALSSQESGTQLTAGPSGIGLKLT